MTVALIDLYSDGHHPTLLLIHTRALLDLGHEVWVFHPNVGLFDGLPEEQKKRLKIFLCKKVDLEHKPLWLGVIHKLLWHVSRDWAKSMIASVLWLRCIAMTRRTVRAEGRRPDQVIFMSIESMIAVPFPAFIVSRFPYPWAGRCFNLRDKTNRFKINWARVGLSRIPNFRALFTLDETSVDALSAATGKPVFFHPDPTDESTEPDGALKDEIKRGADGRKIIALAGTVTSRKGTISFLKSIRASDPAKYFFILAGKPYEQSFEPDELAQLQDFAQHPPENCFVFLERIDDERKFNALIQATDIVYAAYIGFPGSSGILTKTALFEKPVIVSKGLLMDERVQKYNIGLSVNPANIDEIVRAFATLSSAGTEETARRRYKEYFALHSYARLKEVLNDWTKNKSRI